MTAAPAAAQPETLDEALRAARACTLCPDLPLGPRPVVVADARARLLLIGQAPGTKVHETGIPWNDRSGDRLRDWLQLDRDRFYDPARIAILPMGLCYPGVDANGGDLPPRPVCAPTWHPRIRPLLPNVRLTLLIGSYAQGRYLPPTPRRTMTETVADWCAAPPGILPLPHPSWRNTAWMRKNPWFEAELLPHLRRTVADLLAEP